MMSPFIFSRGMYKPLSYVRDMNNKLNEPYEIENDNYVIRGGMMSVRFWEKRYFLVNLVFWYPNIHCKITKNCLRHYE